MGMHMYPPAPDMRQAETQKLTDGELFYKISEGHRPMPSFKKRFTEEQRWQLVLFLRWFSAAQPDRGRGPGE